MDKHLVVAVCSFPNSGKFEKFGKVEKFGKHALAVATPLGSQSCLWPRAKENKDDMPAQAVQDEADLSSAATRRAGFSTAPKPQAGKAQSHASGFDVTITRTSPRGKGPFRGLAAFSHEECDALWNLNILSVGFLNIMSVGFLGVSKPAKMFKPSRGVLNYIERGSLFQNIFLNCWHNTQFHTRFFSRFFLVQGGHTTYCISLKYQLIQHAQTMGFLWTIK